MTESEGFEKAKKLVLHYPPNKNTSMANAVHILCASSTQLVTNSMIKLLGGRWEIVTYINPIAERKFSYTAVNRSFNLTTYDNFYLERELTESNLEYFLLIPFESFKDPTFYSHFWQIVYGWEIVKGWLYKTLVHKKILLNRNYKIMGSLKERKALEPKGRLLVEVFRLCIRCHPYQSNLDVVPYKNGGEWFSHVRNDFLVLELDTLKYPPPLSEKSYKKGFIDYERKNLSTMKNLENPFNNTSAIGLKTLIDACIHLLNKSADFKKSYWDNFLNAYSDYINEINNPNWCSGFVEDDKYRSRQKLKKGGKYDTSPMILGDVTDFKILDYESIFEIVYSTKFKTKQVNQIEQKYYLGYINKTFIILHLVTIEELKFQISNN